MFTCQLRHLGSPFLLEPVDVFPFRQHESQERFSLKSTGLCDAEQKQVMLSDSFEKAPRNFPLNRQMPNRPFSHSVVPGDTVLIQEPEQTLPVPKEPFLIGLGDLAFVLLSVDDILEKAIHRLLVFVKISFFQSILVNVRHDGNKQFLDRTDKSFQLRVERVLPEVVVQVSDQMNKALLLPTCTRIVATIKVRNQYACVVLQYFLNERCFSCFGEAKDYMYAIGQNPNVVIGSSDIDFRLVGMNERACKYFLEKHFLCRGIFFGHA